ncbi:SURF1 family protein [Reyranella sp. CPCC 100927]|uniref:SURF1 family protein n=1 Tax=Reyranella sp. CPCC 100927 TaxID=2599616 RepID=UPI002105113D|nr:SURF1 family protein [Reyranella sp. CPCC 100927]
MMAGTTTTRANSHNIAAAHDTHPAGPTGRSAWTLGFLALAAVIAIAGSAALGVWQLERRAWKLALIDRVEQRIHAVAAPLPQSNAWSRINAKDDAYKRVSASGRFLHDHETLVRAVTARGAGFWVLTPLRTDGGPTVLVNRGFVPPDRRDPASRREGNSAGVVHVTGLLRTTEPGGAFLRANDPVVDRWYSRDVPAIAAARGLADVAPFFIDADAAPNPGGWPIGGLTVVAFSNNHLVYALTWFALAFMLGGALLSVARREWRWRKDGLESGSCTASNPVHDNRHGVAVPDRR